MRFDIITLFPELFEPHFKHGITRRAFESKAVDVRLWQLRDYAMNSYRRVDDRPFGGGPGMVMLVEPLERALAAIRADRGETAGESADAPANEVPDEKPNLAKRAPLVMFTPTGLRLDQAMVGSFAKAHVEAGAKAAEGNASSSATDGAGTDATAATAATDAVDSTGAILLCGRYEGVDQRFIDRHVDIEISVGDFVLSGGELPALTLLDAVARLQQGVLGDAESHQQDSFSDGLLDCPHYSRPEILHAQSGEIGIPAVLKSGNHADIAQWRREQSLALTVQRRPDLIALARAAGRLSTRDEAYLRSLAELANRGL